MLVNRAYTAVGTAGVAAGLGVWRSLATKARGEVLHNSMSDGFYEMNSRGAAAADQGASSGDRPMSGDAGVQQVRRQQSSIMEPPLLHDSMSGADYAYYRRNPASGPRMSSITEPDYYLQDSLGEGTYGMPKVLTQRGASLSATRGQGFSSAKQRPTMQRIVVVNRAVVAESEPLHNSFSHGDYTPRAR